MFTKLNQEDEEFRRKIVDLHRKLSDVDDSFLSESTISFDTKSSKEAERLRELESVARRAEETNSRNAEINAEKRRELLLRERSSEVNDKIKYRRFDTQYERRRQIDPILQRRSRRLEEESGDQNILPGISETNFLNRFRIKRRSMKLLSFLSGRATERSQETTRLLRMYMPDKGSKTQNTISVHHTSRDRRFWKLRNRRRTTSA